MGELISKLKAAELPNEDLKFLQDVIGLEAVQKLLVHAAGMSFYIPTRLPAAFVREYVHREFDPDCPKNSARVIGRALRISERTVWRIIKEPPPPRAARAVA